MESENKKDAVEVLKGLVEICKDGEEGFETAAKNIKEPEYKSLFQSYSQQRARFAAELEAELRTLGTDADETSVKRVVIDAAGAVHRGWINLKSAMTGGSSEAILNECEAGEDQAVKAYKNAIADGKLPLEISHLVSEQYKSIQEAHDRVRALARVKK